MSGVKFNVVGGLNHRKMKEALSKLSRVTGYGGMIAGDGVNLTGTKSIALTEGRSDDQNLEAMEDLLAFDIDGARGIDQIISQIKDNGANTDFEKDFVRNNFAFYTEKQNSLKDNQSRPDEPDKQFEMSTVAPKILVQDLGQEFTARSTEHFKEGGPKLSVVNVLNGNFTPTSKNIDAIELFMNAIPTHEFSRCTPYLDVVFEVNTPQKDAKNQRYGLSLHSVTEGGKSPIKGSGDDVLANNVPAGLGEDTDNDDKRHTFGMEMFTTPQTFAPLSTEAGELRIEPVLDPFRPFMSIKSFDVNLTPVAGGYYQKAWASLKIVLHDRSRMHEIAHLVRPDNFSSNKIYIEYGWSHPDGELPGKKNPYGDFLNSLRKKEKWKLYNSSFNFRQNGEVEISLDLMALGNKAAENMTIDGNEYISDLGTNMMKIESAVITIARKSGLGKEISPEYVEKGSLGKALSSFTPAAVKEVLDKIEKMGTKNKSEYMPAAKELKSKLIEFLAVQKEFSDAASLIIDVIEQDVLKPKPGSDPFLLEALNQSNMMSLHEDFFHSPPTLEQRISGHQEDGTYSEKKAAGAGADMTSTDPEVLYDKVPYVSLGKAMSVFVGRPLSATGKFQEVQMFFYPFALRHGGPMSMNELTTGEFLIKKDELMEGIRHMMTTYRTSSIPIEAFIGFVIQNFVNFIGAPQYGMMNDLEIYQKIENGKRQSLSEGAAQQQGVDDVKKLNAEQKKKINTMNDKLADFIFPKIAVELEAVPRIPGKDDSKKSAEQDTILRIHVYDTHAGKQEPYENLIEASVNNIATLKQIKSTLAGRSKEEKGTKDENQRPAARAKVLNKLIEELAAENPKGLKAHREGVDSRVKEFTINLPYETVKNKIAGQYPFITYGTEATSIRSANFRTIQNRHHKNVILSQLGRSPETAANGLGSDGLPIWTTPTSLSLSSMGCPLFRYRTALFFDFKTGTTIDNVYYAKSVRHSITPGQFTTNLEMATRLADGKYRSLYSLLKNSIEYIDNNTDEAP